MRWKCNVLSLLYCTPGYCIFVSVTEEMHSPEWEYRYTSNHESDHWRGFKGIEKCVSLSNSQAGVLTQIRSGYRWSDWDVESLGTLQKIRAAWSWVVKNIRTLDSLGLSRDFCQTEQDHISISASKAAIKLPWVEEAGSGACVLTMQFLVLASLCHRRKNGT